MAVEVATDRTPGEGEVFIFTVGGAFVVNGTTRDVAARLQAEAWAQFDLAESGDPITIRSDQVVALRGGTRPKRTSIGFVHRD